MQEYLNLLKEIKEKGTWKDAAREGMPRTLSLFGTQMRFDLSKGFPILTTKKVSFKNIFHELYWFMTGNTNIKYLIDNNCNIWNEDAYNYYLKTIQPYHYSYEDFIRLIKEGAEEAEIVVDGYKLGDCGKQYGWLWRDWNNGKEPIIDGHGVAQSGSQIKYVDQLQELVDGIKKNPMSRRHILSGWNPLTLHEMALNTCHSFVQFNCRPWSFYERVKYCNFKSLISMPQDEVSKEMDKHNVPKYYIDCHLYQRSADVVLGVPYNIASYALLTEIVAKLTGNIAGDFIHSFGDVHIYEQHMPVVNEQLKRIPDKLPQLYWNTSEAFDPLPELDDFLNGFEFEDIGLSDYNPQSTLKAKLFTGLS